MKKVPGFLYQVFGWGAYVSIFAGAAGFVGFVVALIIGGDTAGPDRHVLRKGRGAFHGGR